VARVSTYINTVGRTEEALRFYAEVFRSNVSSVTRFSDVGMTDIPEHERDGLMHGEVEIMAGHVLMGTDMIASAGHRIALGNNMSVNLEPDTRDEADRIYAMLSVDSTENSGGLVDMDWGAYWGTCVDRFGIRWMINVADRP
jgi:PhnB protein